MLGEFQQAFADMVASPELCRKVRVDPALLKQRYILSEREWRRLVALANHRGMELNCMLYRANRLAPLAMNLPDLCRALGDELREMASQYWIEHANTDVHFLVETKRFCDFLYRRIAAGYEVPDDVRAILDREAAVVAARLAASETKLLRSNAPCS